MPQQVTAQPPTVGGSERTAARAKPAWPDKTRVLYLIPNLQQGGAERQILATMRHLPARFEPRLCLYNDTVHYSDLLPAQQPAHVLGVRSMGLASLRRLVRIIQQERPKIVHCFRDTANFWGRIAARLAGVPVTISSCRTRLMELRFLLTERFLSELGQLVIVNSVGTQQELTTLGAVRAQRVRVLHNFLDAEHFRPASAAERQGARAALGWRSEARVVLFPGRLGLQKNQLGALLAFRALLRQGAGGRLRLVLVGRESDRWFARRVRALAATAELAPHVEIRPPETDIRRMYWAADALLLPSLWEGMPNALLEGSACGLPAIVSHAANRDSIVVNQRDGIVVETANRTQLVEALQRLAAAPEAALAESGRSARAHVIGQFSADRVAGQLVGIYDELLARAGSTRGLVAPVGGA